MNTRNYAVVAVVVAVLGLAACAPADDPPFSPPQASSGGPGGGMVSASGDTGDTGDTTTGGMPTTDHNYAFVSSLTYVPGELGGLVQADLECQALADAAGLGGVYVAWLSSSATDGKNRLAGARGWVRTDGRPFVDGVTELINGQTLYPLRVDEEGEDVADAVVLTATAATGVAVDEAGMGTCMDWTSADPMLGTSGGVSDAGDELWTQWPALGLDCSEAAHLYCFGIDSDAPLEFTPATGRLAFVTLDVFTPTLGRDVADAQCQQAAGVGGLTGQFLALLATDDASALARFDLDGERWVRPDGVAIVDDAADLATAIVAPLARDAEGSVAPASLVWTGATDPTQASSLASCASWSSLVGQARAGLSGRSTVAWYDSQALECDSELGVLYCLEN